LVVLGTGGPAAAGPARAVLTYADDIAPLLAARCVSCHRPDGSAPFSLARYEDVVPRTAAIARAVASGRMPPWLPSDGGPFRDARALTFAEKTSIADWIAEGARRGAVREELLSSASTGWQLGRPDLVLALDRPFQLRAGSTDVFRSFVLPAGGETARYVRGIEIDPGDPSVVHHASLVVDRTRASRLKDRMDDEPGFAAGMIADGISSPGSRALGWTPGMIAAFEPEGMAWRLDAGTDLVLELHMIPRKATTIAPRVALYFAPGPPDRDTIDVKLGSREIDIPPGERDYAIEDSFVMPVDVRVWSLYPHAHYLARRMTVDAAAPGEAPRRLLTIPEWDFHWQTEYRYVSPVTLAAGTTVTMRYVYDNSSGNRHSPTAGALRVHYGPQATDEMGDLWLRLEPIRREDAPALARAYVEHDRGSALAAAERRMRGDPASAAARNALGGLLLAAGATTSAIEQLTEALRLEPSLAAAHYNLGEALRRQGKMRDSIAHLRAAFAASPDDDVIALGLANALEDNGDLAEAAAQFARALALNPGVAEARNNLGIALASLGRIDEAIEQFERALQIDPGYADARRNLDQARQLRTEPQGISRDR
jgi:Flp pilus assembly protein TadD